MTIEQVEPLKFKGNKTWYLHKLSEKGAGALKTKFPNGIGGEVETTIQAAINELATKGGGGGGGSASSAQPDRVIIIDTTLTEAVPGKAYPTFAAAKTYMEANPLLYYYVELPAGEFNEPVTISEHWLINGNRTRITQPLRTTIESTIDGTLARATFFIQNCDIDGGFVSSATIPGEFSIFGLKDCEIHNNNCGDSQQVVVMCFLCIVDSVVQSNATMWVTHSVIKNCSAGYFTITDSLLAGNIETSGSTNLYTCTSVETVPVSVYCGNRFTAYDSNINGTLSGHELYAYNSSIEGTLNTSEAILENTSFRGIFAAGGVVYLTGCPRVGINGAPSGPNIIHCRATNLYVYAAMPTTTVEMDAKSSLTLGADSEIGTLCCACDTLVQDFGLGMISVSYQPKRFRYSSDKGSTFSDDVINATHVGIIKEPNVVYQDYASVADYVWIPLS